MVLAAWFAMSWTPAASQDERGGKELAREERNLPSFSGVDVGGALEVTLRQAARQRVIVEAPQEILEKITTEVKNDVLYITTRNIRKSGHLYASVEVPAIIFIKASGASTVKSPSGITGRHLMLKASGASTLRLDMDVEDLESVVSGASTVTLAGKAGNHNTDVSGASDLKAANLVTRYTGFDLSGASQAHVHATHELSGKTSGASDLNYSGDPEIRNIQNGETSGYSGTWDHHMVIETPDSTKVQIGGLNIDVYEHEDSVRIRIGNRELFVDSEGNVFLERQHKKARFNGHWAGVDIGINGYVNKDFNMSFPREAEYMDLRMEKSVAVHINFFEQNIPLLKNQKWGILSGLGMHWNNYRFSNPTRLNSDSSTITGFLDRGIDIRKSKLTAFYLDVPLMFEFQTNARHKKNSFHLGTGMMMGIRLSSHTKKYYEERDKYFEVTRYQPASDSYEPVYTAKSPGQSISKQHDDYYLSPFKWDATVRIGWGFINLFGTYSLNSLFRKDKGPELYPWTIGITLTDF